jgi:hypothetical protein
MNSSRLIVILIVSAIAFIAGWGWFSPSGTGEYLDSPDGRYTAHVSNLSHGTWLLERVNYIEIKIVEKSSDRTVWKAERLALRNEVQPTFGDRSKKFIVWTPDSRSVSISISSVASSSWAVP